MVYEEYVCFKFAEMCISANIDGVSLNVCRCKFCTLSVHFTSITSIYCNKKVDLLS
ncbi:hypothetical protein HDC92_000651 [Pedobacter sp. AK017]|nr:hypothetical protein [Pedobacter sp. AK017]